MKLLLVEDEQFLLEEMDTYLTEQGYRCEKATTYTEGQEKLHLYHYDAIVLDITLPGGNGLSLLEILKKQHKNVGVLILSAKDSLYDKITGLEMGADDYITKPFHLEELNARIFSLLRRRTFDGENEVKFDSLVINMVTKTVSYKDESIVLTKKEYELLLYFIVNKNRVVSKQAIAEHLWGDHYDMAENYDTVYVYTMNLRKKITTYTGIDYIKTVYGMGYKWIA
ncbi:MULTISPECIES: response regulator transcription factor [Arcicella]|uniref:Response regulator transcription factor n=2 Tax=Arcicella TaxID=217140 RepID=A0ABU5SR51_9BACT|nr:MULTISPECIES: response regulator transcription factor [unclassified Arcicella]MDR6563784.1 DNA-binding response OmpR family regulator [Arcicella sp. BE51]MDR6813532.1 DNA-binding response OmpR family regulator [Arcicella sp. BE140]MDR6824845.1 DNA-binding response OmpR family regulator [Arcicella sp. BE139]MEA5402753.1 response regulator transcription factor [Arcicella sp. DC2W]MEA5429384.1 response regulator transcription factor [Arcicella sp. DC25W]